MDRALTVTTTLPSAAGELAHERFLGDVGAWLADGARRLVDSWQAEVRVGRLRQPVVATVGPPIVHGRTVWRTLRWTPVRQGEGHEQVAVRQLPDFLGRIGLHQRDDERVELVLQGFYDPPAGRLGSVLDGLLLRKVAEVTAHQLVGDIADRLVRLNPDLVIAASG